MSVDKLASISSLVLKNVFFGKKATFLAQVDQTLQPVRVPQRVRRRPRKPGSKASNVAKTTAAVQIQKIWRGFSVRKIRPTGLVLALSPDIKCIMIANE